MENVLKNLEARLADERESIVDMAMGVIGACRRIIIARTLKAKKLQRANGVENDDAPEIKALAAQMAVYHRESEAILRKTDVDAIRRTFTEHKIFADKFGWEVLEHSQRGRDITGDIPNLNGGPI